MNNFWIMDIEANGLLEDVTTIWCVVAKELNGTSWEIFNNSEGITDKEWLARRLRLFFCGRGGYTPMIMHNGIAYDIPVIEKVTGYRPSNYIHDTLIHSRVNNPDREGGHSLEDWGKRLGFPKGNHKDFTKYTPEMLEYCKRDVLLTEKVFLELLNENQI